jgi:hypothetical protein
MSVRAKLTGSRLPRLEHLGHRVDAVDHPRLRTPRWLACSTRTCGDQHATLQLAVDFDPQASGQRAVVDARVRRRP